MAESLEQLLGQIRAYYPTRSTVSDGGLGDAAHAARTSDHNPDAAGVVHARDFTHDPAVFDAHAFADRLVAARDPRVTTMAPGSRTWAPTPTKNTSTSPSRPALMPTM